MTGKVDVPKPTAFPGLADNNRHDPKVMTLDIGSSISYRISKHCEAHGLSVQVFLEASWAILLAQFSGADEVQFLSKKISFDSKELECSVKYCTASLEPTNTLESLLQEGACIRYQTLHAIADVRAKTGILVQEYQSYHLSSNDTFANGQNESCRFLPDSYQVFMIAKIWPQGPSLIIQFRTSVVSGDYALRLVSCISTIAETLINAGSTLIKDLDLSPDHAGLIWDACQNSQLSTPGVDACVHDLIENRSLIQPDSVAVSAWDGQFTYFQLHHHASHIASRLLGMNVKPGEFVPLCFEKSKWTAVAILGVLQAGAAFVLLEPSYPINHLKSICRDLRNRFILSSIECQAKAEQLGDVVIALPGNDTETTETHLRRISNPHSPVYAVFTSGTTGKPKGISIEHAAYCSSAIPHAKSLLWDDRSRVLQLSSYAFDVGIADYLTTLIVGGTICIPSEFERDNDLLRMCQRTRVNWAHLTPSVVRLLEIKVLKCLKTLAVIGESMTEEDIAAWSPHVNLISSYGPAECSVVSTTCPVTPSSHPRDIGRPIEGNHCWVVNPNNHNILMPFGAVGELVIQGPILAREYLNEPIKTAAAFIKSPDWMVRFPSLSKRLYKTGDLVHYTPNKDLRFVGRKDTQIKLSGQRVELEEVETHILRYFPGAKKVIVDVIKQQEAQGLSQILAAFIYSSEDDSSRYQATKVDTAFAQPSQGFYATTNCTQSELAELLPRYMIPSLFIPLNYIPLSITGKINRRRLRELASSLPRHELLQYSDSQTSSSSQEDREWTTSEKIIQELFATALRLKPDDIGLKSNFFHLGGDSVAAIKLVGAARRDHGLPLTVANVFSTPNIVYLAQVLGDLTLESQRNDLAPFFHLEQMQVSNSINAAAIQCQVRPSDISDIYPCTPLQEGVFFLTTENPATYVARYVYQLPKTLNIPKFRKAWESVADANPILKTRLIQLPSSRKGLHQAVVNTALSWHIDDNIEKYIQRDSAKPVELGGELVRLAIVEDQEANSRLLVLSIHHALFDAWSLPLILQKLEHSYTQEVLHLSARSFSNFVAYISQIDEEASKKTWGRLFDDPSFTIFPSISLPYTRGNPRSAKSTSKIGHYFAKDFTVSTAINLAWALTQAAYTSSNDVVFGTTLSGRNASIEDIETLIGPTICTLPVRVQFTPQSSVRECLQLVNDMLIALMPYEQIGLQNLSTYSHGCAKACEFQTLLTIEPKSDNTAGSGMLWALCKEHSQNELAYTYPLTVSCYTAENEIDVEILFDESVVDEMICQSILEQFLHTIKQIAKCVDDPVSNLLSASPFNLSNLVRWNQKVPDIVDECLNDRICKIAALQPEALAINAWDGQFTYQELEGLSAVVADHLISLGLAVPDSFVALCFEKSKWVAVSMLGVMRAGLAFVMLEPSDPLVLMKDIYIDSGSIALLCSASMAPLCQNITSATKLVVEHVVNSTGYRGVHKNVNVKPHHALYAVYTSGSTGKSKGIVIEHTNYATAAQSHLIAYRITSDTRLFQFASYSFDVGVSENLLILLAGGVLCIPSETQRLNNFVKAFSDLNANHVELTPSFARLFQPQDLPCLRVLVMGGEAMVDNDISIWADKVHLISSYGPAECSVTCTAKMMTVNEKDPKSIGFPIGCVCWVTNAQDHNILAPIGAIGELVIEGPILGRGYLNDEVKTHHAYIDAPFWLHNIRQDHHHHGRVFKTGDLVKYHSDGSLIYVSRMDEQRKLYGQRIELGQVEHYLRRSFPGQTDVAAEIVTPAGQSTSVLAAFISSETFSRTDKISVDISTPSILMRASNMFRSQALECERRLRNQLSRHMIPSVFLQLSCIPLTRNGKQNRTKLREMASSLSPKALADYSISGAQKRATTTVTEELLQKLFGKILGLTADEIGIDDNYFQLGGQSIGAIGLVAMAKRENLELSIADIFSHPTISDLASIVKERADESSKIVPAFSLIGSTQTQEIIQKMAVAACKTELDLIDDIYPCTPLQEGLMALTAKDPQSYIGRFQYKLPPSVDPDRLQLSWNAVVRSNPILRTRIFQTPSGKMYQVVLATSVECIRSGNLNEYLSRDSTQSMCAGGALVRLAILPDGNAKNVLQCVLVIHHALYDGWSLSLLLDQVEKTYAGNAPLRKAEFNLFVEYTQRLDSSKSEKYWNSKFEHLDPVPFPSSESSSAQHIPSITGATEHLIHLNVADRLSYAPSTAIQLAWSIVQAQKTDSQDVVFGLVVAGRSAQPEFQDVTGPTFATIPQRINLQQDCSIYEMLETIQTQLLTTIPFEHAGLQNIARYGPNCASACQFKTLLVIQPSDDLHTQVVLSEIEQPMERNSGFNSYPMTLVSTLNSDGVLIQAFFDPYYIVCENVQKCLRQFGLVLQQIYEDPYRTLGDITMLSQEDIDQLKKWNRVVPAQECGLVHDLIAQQVQLQPQAIAVCAWDGGFTYSQLDEMSSLLASHLMSLNIGPEKFVPLYFDRSKWAILALLGLIKAGGTVVFLDPSHPYQRNKEIIQLVGAHVILASVKYAGTCKIFDVEEVVVVSEGGDWWRKQNSSWKPSFIDTKNALYTVFTSGSTGAPKCAVVTHGSFCASMRDHSKLMRIRPNIRALQFSSWSFDGVYIETLSVLYAGGTICTPSDFERQNDLSGAINRLAVEWAMITPSLARSMHPQNLSSLRTLCLVGEPVLKADIEIWKPYLDLIIGYGPSECSAISAVQPDAKTTDINPNDLGITTGCNFWIVDKESHNRLVPPGVVGEILIEGPILGRGYLKDEARTKNAWIEFPSWMQNFRGASHGRLYKTGDLGKFNCSGRVQIMGRMDTQVKLRGQRIELQAIEYYLNAYFEGSMRAVVEIIHPQGGNPTLAAFIKHESKETALVGLEDSTTPIFTTSKETSQITVRAAQTHLKTIFPIYMVPLLFLEVMYFPLGRTAKLDRRRLRDEVASMSWKDLNDFSIIKVNKIEKFPPATELEKKLQALFATVLDPDLAKITRHSNFFSSGGDSIAAMSLVSMARNEGISFTVADVFHFPTVSELASKIATSTCEQIASIDPFSLLDEDDETSRAVLLNTAAQACSTNYADIVDIYPCTSTQEALILATLKTPTIYTHRLIYKLPSDVEPHRFEEAWYSVIRANAILRTRIIQNPKGTLFKGWSPGLVQVVTASSPTFIRTVGSLRENLHDFSSEPFGLGENLLRLGIFEDDTESFFVLLIHHSLYDWFSLPVIFDEVGSAYGKHVLKSTAFNTFVDYLCRLDRSAAREFWEREFKGLNASVFPEVSSFELKPSSNRQISYSNVPLLAASRYTNAAMIQLAWSIVQCRYTRSNDVVFGLVSSGRGAPVTGIENMSCPIIATIPLRTILQPNQTVSEALDMTQKHVADVIPWEQIGLQAIRRIGECSARACDFKTLLVIINRQEATSPQCFGEELLDQSDSPFNEYPLTIECQVRRDSTNIQMTFDPEIVKEGQMRQITEQFIYILKQVTEEPGRTIQNLSVTSPLDTRLLMGWNQTRSEKLDVCIHSLISERAAEQPNQQAICSWDGILTYEELEDLSSSFATHLRNKIRGFSISMNDHFIPVYAEKTKWTTVAMLGILKAGFAFVLLDPSHPLKRLRRICQTLKAEFIVTTLKQEKAASLLAQEIVVVDGLGKNSTNSYLLMERDARPTDVSQILQNGYAPPTTIIDQSADIAFAVFTSGSSGEPKGIPIEHGGFSTTSRSFGKFLNLNRMSRVLQFSSYAFDVCVSDILSTLIMGGCVCIPSESQRINDLSAACEQLGVNWANLTPSALRTLDPERVKSLKTLVFGGESISQSSLSLWEKRLDIFQLYGPAETGGIVTVHPHMCGQSDPRNIGFPSDVACWVVDELNHEILAPVGATGELVVQSSTLARGYIENMGRGASPFINAPEWAFNFSPNISRARFYKTGDLVKYNLDGSLHFVGRKDTQVKFYGQRIELYEVEEQIRLHDFPDLKDTVVEMIKSNLSRFDTSSLVAFLYIERGPSVNLLAQVTEDFRFQASFLEAKLLDSLPRFMVPSIYLPVNFIPLGQTGKIDRRTLREEASKTFQDLLKAYNDPSLSYCKRLPSSEVELRLQKMWAEILDLRIDQVGVDDNFFYLGGDSIAAIKLVALARQNGLHFTVADVFNKKCLSKLAPLAELTSETKQILPFSLIKGDKSTQLSILQEAMKKCRVTAKQVKDIYPCTALQQGIMALSVKDGSSSSYFGQSVFRLQRGLNIDTFCRAWDATIKATAILQTRIIQLETKEMFQVVVDEKIPWTNWLSSSKKAMAEPRYQVEEYIKQDLARSFKLGDSLVRMALVSQESETYFILTMLHALYDDWSWPLIYQQVEAAYGGEILQPLAFNPFIDYIIKLDESSSRAFWQTQLAGIKARSFPPFSTSKNTGKATSQVRHKVTIAKNSTHSRNYREPFTIATKIRLAWALVQAQYSRSNDVVFGWIASGRNSPVPGIEKIIGPTIATVPLRVSFESYLNSSVGDALKMINDQAMAMIPFEQSGLQKIAQYSQDAEIACKFGTLLAIQPLRRLNEGSLFADDCTEYFLPVIGSHALSVLCTLTDDGFDIQAIFDAGTISPAQVLRLLQQLDHNFSNFQDSGLNRSLSEVMCINSHDIQQLREWNGIQFPPVESCVHDLIHRHPDTIAVCAWDGTLTYRELGRLSSNLAFRLSNIGVEPETFVPVCFEKSMWIVVAVLGVMKAGGAFVLLDPSQPMQTLVDTIRKVKAKLIITSRLQSKIGVAVEESIILGAHELESDNGRESWSSERVTPNNALYAVLTPSSSAKPKAAVIEHNSYCSTAEFHIEAFGLGTDSRVLHFASYTSDASILEIITVLLAGGCICMPSEADIQNNLAQVIVEFQVNWMELTPSVARLLQADELKSLQTLVLVGEPMSSEDVSSWSKRTRLIYSYGPSEASITASIWQNISVESDPRGIGSGSGANLWIVDESNPNKLVPIGVVGELLIEGPIVGRGYLDEPADVQASFFRQSPPAWLQMFRHDSSTHIYRTGDLVQYNEDGSMRFVGRKDSQINVKGQWIEPGELEHQINNLFSNSKAVLVERVVPAGSTDPIMVAFVWCGEQYNKEPIASNRRTLTQPTDAFRAEVVRVEGRLQELPPFMVPKFFVPLGFVPLSITGKVDRGQLRKAAERLSIAELSSYDIHQYQRSPQSDTERTLQSLIAEVLDLEADAISVTSNILRLGIDSISALRLIGLARESGLEFSMADIFSCFSIAALAPVVRTVCDEPEVIRPFSLLDGIDLTVEHIRSLAAETCQVEPSQIEDIYPCTSLQEAIMALDAKQVNYTTLAVYDLPEDIDIARFRSAWDRTIEANLILRTRIVQITSTHLLQVVTNKPVNWHVGQNLDEYLDHHARTPMGLGDSLIRLAIIENPERPRQFILTIRHTIYDGWSFNLLMEQLKLSYDGQQLQRNTFNRFIHYVLKLDINEATRFWKSEFADCAASVFPALPSQTYSPAATDVYEQMLSWKESAPAREYFGTSTILQLAWGIVQSRYTSSEDTLFGVTLSGRNAPVSGVEQIVGPTFTTVPLRCQLQRGGSVKANLQMIQNKFLAMIPFEQTGLHYIRKMVGEAAANWQFQTLLLVQAPKSRGQTLFQESDSEHDQPAYSSYALLLECKPDLVRQTLTIRAHFDPYVLRLDQVETLIQTFSHIIYQIQQSLDEPLERLELINPSAFEKLATWNIVIPDKVNSCVHELFQRTALANPHQQAIVAWDGEASYESLNQMSSRVAAHLIELGVGAESIVPCCFEKSIWAVVSILAILKAGGAIVPLDPSYPSSRLREIISVTRAKFMLCSPQCKGLVEFPDLKLIVVSSTTMETFPVGQLNSTWTSKPNDTAYLVFTSGSSGKPKGIVFKHASICTYIRESSLLLEITSSSRVLQFASFAFDVSTMEIFLALINGGTLCIPAEEQRLNNVEGFITQYGVNWAFFTPSVLRLIQPERVLSLKTIALAGEPVGKDNFDIWASKVSLVNVYGPAECAISAVGQISTNWIVGTVGLACGGCSWIVDETDPNILMPIGAIGELLFEGPVVAEKYLNDAMKTEAVFIDAPSWLRRFRSGRQGRLYLTGDLVQYNPDGSFKFIARKDRQIKLRGQRIEPAEVEYHLRQTFSGLEDVVVDVITNLAGTAPTLLALISISWKASRERDDGNLPHPLQDVFVNPKHPSFFAFQKEADRVKSQLKKLIPSYMIPNTFVPVTRLPKTLTNKIDRRKLLEMALSLSQETITSYTIKNLQKHAPSTKIEISLQHLLARILGTDSENIGLDDNFFDLGLDSITAMRLVSLGREHDLYLTTKNIFQHPYITSLASIVTSKRTERKEEQDWTPFSLLHDPLVLQQGWLATEVSGGPSNVEDILGTSYFQGMMSTEPCRYFMIQMDGALDVSRLENTCQGLVHHNAILRTLFKQHLGYSFQIVLKEVDFKVEVLESTGDPAEFAESFCRIDIEKPVPRRDPPTSFTILRSTASRHILVIKLSHAQYDGLSLPMLCDRITALYLGKPHPTAPSFPTYLYESASRSTPDVLEKWKYFLDKSSMTFFDCKEQVEYVAISASQEFSPKTLPKGYTVASIIKAAWAKILMRHTNQIDVVFGQFVNGRNSDIPQVENILGPCVNIIPVRVQSGVKASILDQVHEQQIQTLAIDFVQLKDIINKCTDWPPEVRFGSVVHHLTISEKSSFLIGDEIICSTSFFFRPSLSDDVYITSMLSSGRLCVSIDTSSRLMNESLARRLLRELCNEIMILLE